MQDKIKIVQIINSLALGGAEKLLLDLCASLDKEKFEVAVIAVNGGGLLEEQFKKLNIPVFIFKKKTKIGLGVIWQTFRLLRKIKPQIVHTHLFGGDTWGRIPAIFARIPVIISTEHSLNLNESPMKSWVKHWLSLWTDKIIAVSTGIKDNSIRKDKIKPDKIAVIYNGVDTRKFVFRGYQPIDLNKIKAAIIGRLSEEKGQQFLLEAMPLILKKYPGFILNIIGAGKSRPDLQQIVKQLEIADRVLFWGARQDIDKILAPMDLLISASLWEGLPGVLLEAQAVGVPVIATDIVGTREVVADRQTGLLVEPKNPQAIFQAVDLLLSRPDLVKQMVANAPKQVIEKFTLARMTKDYENLYLNLLAKKK